MCIAWEEGGPDGVTKNMCAHMSMRMSAHMVMSTHILRCGRRTHCYHSRHWQQCPCMRAWVRSCLRARARAGGRSIMPQYLSET